MVIGSVSLMTAGDFLCANLWVTPQNVSHQLMRSLPQFVDSLPQIDVLAEGLTEGVSELFTRKTRLRVNTR